MDKETRAFLDGVYPYFKILEGANKKLRDLLDNSYDKAPHENEELFYQIASDIIRLYPYSKKEKNIKNGCGILLLKQHISFIVDDYQKLLENSKLVSALNTILEVRNKYEHEPHNISFASSLSSSNSCSMRVQYKDRYLSLSTTWMTNIIYDLNTIFEKIKDLYMQTMDNCDAKYREYPCYKTICNIDFKKYNQNYKYEPWYSVMIDDSED